MRLIPNPFIFTRAVTRDEFLGRKREINQLFSRLLGGQSIAVIGQPHIGKTSLLKHVQNENVIQQICSNRFEKDLFVFIDAQTLKLVDTQAGFWSEIFKPIIEGPQNGSSIKNQIKSLYDFAQKNNFSNFVLQQLFSEFSRIGSRLILLLDEFDVFLSHPKLHSTEFYGGLRSLASCSRGLVLVIASRRSLSQLTEQTKSINPFGSPYFNIFSEMPLAAFSKNELEELLDKAGDKFSANDRRFISELTGRHPYLAQVTAAKLWEVYDEGRKTMSRYFLLAQELCKGQFKMHFKDTWGNWSCATKKAITIIALVQIYRSLQLSQLPAKELIQNLSDFASELEVLEDNGLLIQDDSRQWHISQAAFLWWLVDHMRLCARNESGFKAWLQENEIDNMLKDRERENMFNISKKVMLGLKNGAITMIENFVKRFAADNGEVPPPPPPPQKKKILFLAADPTDASRLRLGEEFREIQAELNLATCRSRLKLELPELSIRPEDISRALLNKKPQIVHFSGHGSANGALCFEDKIGNAHFVEAEALAALFEQFAQQVECVILNACYSDIQAIAIAQHINYVIGMNQAISDEAAIDFSKGFYQALGAGRSIEEAYKFGCVQIRLQGIPEHLTPVLMKEGKLHSAAKKSRDLSE